MNMFASVSIGIAIVSVVGVVLARSASSERNPTHPAKVPDQPAQESMKAARDHAWLKQLVGEWDSTLKMHGHPDQPPAESKGSDSVRAIGDYWVVAETTTTMMGAPYSGVLSLGYDRTKQRFHGTWIDSTASALWIYTGTLNEAGDTLTLETEGPSPQQAAKTIKYRQIIQITGKDSRTMSLSVNAEGGKWMTIITNEYRRTK